MSYMCNRLAGREDSFGAYEPSARTVFVSILGVLSVASNPAQTPAPRAVPTSSAVVSIKPNRTGSEARRAGSSPRGMFTATNVSLRC
jgi:hypothetical protein